ncbi:MAG: PrsW family glutamic-type intramembrane protease [Bacteroidota bacterium]
MSIEPIIIILIAPVVASIYLLLSSRYAESEFHKLLRDSFLYGIIAFIVSVLLIVLMDALGLATTRSLNRTLFYSFVVVGFLEQLPRFLIFMLIIARKEAFNTPTKGILLSIALSLGFVLIKNTWFVLTNGGLHFSETSGFLDVPAQILVAVVMGFFLSYGAFLGSKFIYPLLALGSASFFHGLYQFSIFSKDNMLMGSFFGLVLLLAILLFRKMMRTNPEDLKRTQYDAKG